MFYCLLKVLLSNNMYHFYLESSRFILLGIKSVLVWFFLLSYLPLGLLLVSVTHVVEVGEWETIFKLGKFTAVILAG